MELEIKFQYTYNNISNKFVVTIKLSLPYHLRSMQHSIQFIEFIYIYILLIHIFDILIK